MSEFEQVYELILKKLLLLSQKQLTHIDQIYSYTKDLSDSISRNDHTSSAIVLKMRGEEILEVDKIKREIENIVSVQKTSKERLQNLLKGIEVQNQTDVEKRICTISMGMKETVKKVIEIDKFLNNRLVK